MTTHKKTKLKWILVYPYNGIRQVIDTYENLALEILATMLRADGHDVLILDAFISELENEKIAEIILERQPDIVGITVDFSTITGAIDICNVVKDKSPEIYTCLGGQHVSFIPKLVMDNFPQVDFILRGEAEYNILKISNAVLGNLLFEKVPSLVYRSENKIIINEIYNIPGELDKLPFPDRDLVDIHINNGKLPIARLITSRGCSGRCTFCSTPNFLKLMKAGKDIPYIREMSVARIIEQIEELYYNKNISFFYFHDDDFIGDGDHGFSRAEEFAKKIIAKKLSIRYKIQTKAKTIIRIGDTDLLNLMKVSGLERVFIGFESGDNNTLKNLYKKQSSVKDNITSAKILEKKEIPLQIGFIAFHPYIDEKEIKNNISFLRKIQEMSLWSNVCSPFEAFPGMPLTERLFKDKLLQEKDFLEKNIWKFKNPRIEELYSEWRYVERNRLGLDNVVFEIKFSIPWWKRLVDQGKQVKLDEKESIKFNMLISKVNELYNEINLIDFNYARDSLELFKQKRKGKQITKLTNEFLLKCSELEKQGIMLLDDISRLNGYFKVAIEQDDVGLKLSHTSDLKLDHINEAFQ